MTKVFVRKQPARVAVPTREARQRSRWRKLVAAVIAVGALQLTWMMGFEAWHRRWLGMFAAFALVIWPLTVAAWRPRLPPRRSVTAALAVALVLLDLAADLWFDFRIPPPFPTRFFCLPWELARVAVVFAASASSARAGDNSSWRRLGRGLRVTSGVAVATLLGLTLFIALTGVRDEAALADGALVLGADLDPEGRPGVSLVGRIERGAQLYRDGLVPRLVVTGGKPRGGRTEGEVARDLLIAAGVPSSAIVVERRATNTEENFACVVDVLGTERTTRVLVVTEPWHMPRAMYQGRRYGLDIYQAPASSAVWRDVRHASFALWSEAFAYTLERVRRLYQGKASCPGATSLPF